MARRVAPAPAGLPPAVVGVLLAVRAASELALLAGAAWVAGAAGARAGGAVLAVVLGIAAALAVAAAWGVWVAPASHRRLTDPLRLGLEVALFAGVTAALLGANGVAPAVLLAVVGLGTALAVRALPSSRDA
jgi:hypothetical protein